MGYLQGFEHDAFVSYAHSDLNAWSRGFVDVLKGYVAGGLSLKKSEPLDFWMDNQTEGNFPLTENLKRKVEGSAFIIIFLTEQFLISEWCTSELGWFNATMAKKARDLSWPVFVVDLHGIEHERWPKSLRDLPGYEFVEDRSLKLPYGHSGPSEKPKGDDFYLRTRRVAQDMVKHIKGLETPNPKPPPIKPVVGPSSAQDRKADLPAKRRLYLAAVPEESRKLRQDLAALLAPHFDVVPDKNPSDPKVIKEQAATWMAGCERCVAILGSLSGFWEEDDDGFVLFQQRVFEAGCKPIFNYRSSKLGEPADLDEGPYRDFVVGLQLAPAIGLDEFARRVIEAPAPVPEQQNTPVAANVYLVADGDKELEKEVRELLGRLQVMAFPLPMTNPSSRDLADLNRDDTTRTLIGLSKAVLLLHGEGKTADHGAIQIKAATIRVRFAPELGQRQAIAIVDGPPEPRFDEMPLLRVFKREAPDFAARVGEWLAKLAPPAPGLAP